MPRAVVVRAFGSPEGFTIEERDPGAPGRDEVRVRIHAAGVSFVDVLIAEGRYQLKPPLPFVPGSEVAGIIEAVGENVPSSRIGERVCAAAFGSAFSEVAVVAASQASRIPETMSFEEASVFRVSYATAYHALAHRGSLQRGEIVCVLGAAGAVGYAAVQIGKALGATVIASASSPEKRAFALSGGADHAIDSNADDWRAQVKAASNDHGLDVVVDPVGDRFSEPAFRSLSWNGRHLVIGFAGGQIPKLATNLALLKGASLVGVDIRQFGIREPQNAAMLMPAITALYEAGRIRPPVASTYSIDGFAEAMLEAKAGRTAGRVVIRMR
ncbi:MAG: NADPH:quinone oxidoreductase family protein [Sphingomonadaceae bacterium]|nr:NADPH:quinone oxidoreductase family protein [Sphingomonadaceae bacterium]